MPPVRPAAPTTQHRHDDHDRSLVLYLLAAVAEIGGAWLIWPGVRERRGVAFIGAGIVSLALYGFVATLQEDANFGVGRGSRRVPPRSLRPGGRCDLPRGVGVFMFALRPV